ncbi:MAG: PorT family protein [Fibrobacteraceae bacterium]|nr:PorT family protein [Fibrobacteraceae bacterium]
MVRLQHFLFALGLFSTAVFAAPHFADENLIESSSDHYPFQVGIYVNGGYNTYWSDADAQKFNGFVARFGGSLLWPFMDRFSFNPQILVAYRYASHETDIGSGFGSYSETFSGFDLELPLLVRADIASGFFCEAGLLAALNVTDNYKNTYEDYETGDTDHSTGELSVSFGAGYKIMKKMEVNARLDLGLTRVYDTEDPDMNPRTYMISLGATYWVM